MMAGSGKQSRPQLNENNDQENVNNSPRNRQSRGGGLRRQACCILYCAY